MIFFRRGRSILGQLIGLPGEVVQVNKIGIDGRYIASAETQTVPENKVAIRFTPDGSAVTLVDFDEVKGRVTTDLSRFITPSKAVPTN